MLEERIIKKLDFDLRFTSPIMFLERYQRIYGIDLRDDENAKHVDKLARRLLQVMVGHSSFLNFKASQMAGAALLLSMNMLQSQTLANLLGLPSQLSNLYQK